MKTVKHFHNADELKELIQAAQKGEQGAIYALCEAFRPLIIQEAHCSYVVQALGEEAENTAWMLFLEIIMSYKDKKYMVLPGLIKKNLHFELMHLVYPRTITSVDAALFLDETDADGHPLHDIANDQLVDNQFSDTNYLNQLLKHLTKKQRDVIEATILGSQTLDDYRLQRGLSFTTVYLHQQRGLQRLRKALQN